MNRRNGELISTLGYLKTDEAFSFVEANGIDTSAGQSSANIVKEVRLRFPNDISSPLQLLKTQALREEGSDSEFVFLAGDIIRAWSFVDESGRKLDDNLNFMAGYICAEVATPDGQKKLATRVAAQNNQVSGRLLNQHGILSVDQTLKADSLASEVALYASEASSQGIAVPATPSYDIVSGNSFVGELKALKPCVTVTSGTLSVGQICIIVSYTPAC
jgi:hypothetical protein